MHAKVGDHLVVEGRTDIGAGTRIFPFSSIGHQPQDLKYQGEPSTLTIGKNCTIRENVTINPGTATGIMATRIGDNCLLMASVHVAHDAAMGVSKSIVLMLTIDKAKFRKPATPGDQIEFHIRKIQRRRTVGRYEAKAMVNGVLIAEAEVGAMIVPEGE